MARAKKDAAPKAPEDPNSIGAKLTKLERKYGKGHTYAPGTRKLIWDKVVPEWVCRAALVAPSKKDREWAENMMKDLELVHRRLWPQIRDESDDKKAED